MRFIILLFSFMFVSTSYAEYKWAKTGETDEATFYVDYSKVRKVNNVIYFYELRDHLEPPKTGSNIFSVVVYSKVTCDTYQRKILQIQNYEFAMGRGEPILTPKEGNGTWYSYDDNYGKGLTNHLCEKY